MDAAVAAACADQVVERQNLGVAGKGRSGSTVTLPARSTSAPDSSPSWDATLDASTPGAQIAVRVGMRSVEPSGAATVTDSSSMSTTVRAA